MAGMQTSRIVGSSKRKFAAYASALLLFHVFWYKIDTYVFEPLIPIGGIRYSVIIEGTMMLVLLMLPAVGFMIRRRLLLEFSLIRFPAKMAKFWLLTLIAFAAALALSYFAGDTADDLFGKPTHYIQNYGGEFDAALIAFIFLAATNEELIFRLVLRDLAGLWTNSRIVVALISGLLFGLAHIDQGATVAAPACAMGMALMVVYILTRTIYAPIIIHVGHNLLTYWADTENARRIAGLE